MKARKAKKLYEDFSGRRNSGDFTVDLKPMKNLVFLGECVAVEYEAEKHTDRKPHVYRHEFETPVMLLTNGRDIIIYGEKIKITERGIEN